LSQPGDRLVAGRIGQEGLDTEPAVRVKAMIGAAQRFQVQGELDMLRSGARGPDQRAVAARHVAYR
jgi:hypothetical protein